MNLTYGFSRSFGGFGFGFGFFQIIFMLVFGIVLVMIIMTLFKSIKEWSHNNRSPLLTVKAKVVGKRVNTRVSRGMHGADSSMHSTSTFHTYYVTFQVDSGDRMELMVPENEYGYLIEGDRGDLSFKGTRFMGFERSM
ncbi:MAG: DUF2500 domain-containing protein [Lachnospiraceae bacterium]|nr:DUF2500 domain-containing protein [Lachnospiraceae bacterium]